MKPNFLYPFTDKKFVEQLTNAINGHAPWKKKEVRYAPKADKPPTEKQVYWLKKKGLKVPETSREASEMLNKVFAK